MTVMHSPLEEFYITMSEGLPSHTAVMEHVTEPPRSHRDRSSDPWWAVLCVLLGAALLVGSGTFLIVLGVRL